MITLKDIADKLKYLRTEIDNIKKTQYLGSSSVTGYTSDSGDTWDWEGTISNTPFFNNQSLIFRFLADKQEAPFGKLRVVTDPSYPTGGAEGDGDITVRVDQDYFFMTLAELEDSKLIGMYVTITNNTGSPLPVKIKGYFDATDRGTVTVRVL